MLVSKNNLPQPLLVFLTTKRLIKHCWVDDKALRLFFSCVIIIFASFPACGQTIKRELPFGVFTMAGNSAGLDRNINSPVNNQITEFRHGYVATGFYKFIKLKNDSLQGYIRYLKVDLAYFAFRSGTFDIGNGNLARLGSGSTDLSVILPLSFKVTSEIEGYVAFGAFLSYRYLRTVTPTQTAPSVSTGSAFRPGYVVEFGFKTLSGSAIGTRLMVELSSNDYPLTSAGIFFAFLPTTKTRIE